MGWLQGAGLADVDKVQLWLVLLSGWAANEEEAAKEERGGRSREKSERALDEERLGEGSRGTGCEEYVGM